MPPLTQNKLEQIARDIEQLKPLPTNTLRIVRALEDPDVSASTLADLIRLDQALAANLLRLANSALLGYTTHCASIHQAVVRVGLSRVRTLTLGFSAAQTLQADLKGYELKSADAWRHALVVATTARYLASVLGQGHMEEAYIAGLLHDIGKVVLDQYVQVDYAALTALLADPPLPLWQAEKQQLGMDHGAVGGLMTERWSFPSNLVDAIRYHHSPAAAPARHRPLAALTHLANALTLPPEKSLAARGADRLQPDALRLLNLDEAHLAEITAAMPDFNHLDLSAFDD